MGGLEETRGCPSEHEVRSHCCWELPRVRLQHNLLRRLASHICRLGARTVFKQQLYDVGAALKAESAAKRRLAVVIPEGLAGYPWGFLQDGADLLE